MPAKKKKRTARKRNKSEGWKHAKKQGHALEKWLAKQLRSNESFSEWLSEKCGKGKSKGRAEAYAGGRHADKIPSVFDDQTTSKADVAVHLDPPVLVSVKMSDGGQVWLVTVERFIGVVEKVYGSVVPKEVGHGLKLFFGELSSKELDGAHKISKLSKQERHQHRLNAKTMKAAYPNQYREMTTWLAVNLPSLVRLAFGRGLAKNESDEAKFVWYVTAGQDFDVSNPETSSIYAIEDLVTAVAKVQVEDRLKEGLKNGGTAFATPFGHLQMHQNQLQFHHKRELISKLLKSD